MSHLWKVDWEDLAWDQGFKGDDKAMLSHYHHTERLTQVAIGKILNLCDATIGKRMRLLNIEVIKYKTPLAYRGPRLPKG